MRPEEEEVLHKKLDGYKGTIQSDAYSPYKDLESPDIKRIACFQYVKRKFIPTEFFYRHNQHNRHTTSPNSL